MLMRSDPFRELDRLTQQVFGATGTAARPSTAQAAKPRKISIASKGTGQQTISA